MLSSLLWRILRLSKKHYEDLCSEAISKEVGAAVKTLWYPSWFSPSQTRQWENWFYQIMDFPKHLFNSVQKSDQLVKNNVCIRIYSSCEQTASSIEVTKILILINVDTLQMFHRMCRSNSFLNGCAGIQNNDLLGLFQNLIGYIPNLKLPFRCTEASFNYT